MDVKNVKQLQKQNKSTKNQQELMPFNIWKWDRSQFGGAMSWNNHMDHQNPTI